MSEIVLSIEGNEMRYTREMLAALATAAGYETSERTIKDWDERGFLPEPSNERVGSEPAKGRAPLSYPEKTPDVVIWLAQNRQFIDGDDTARLWLWFEGLYHRELDVRGLLLGRLEKLWETIRASIPQLGEISADDDVTEFERDDALTRLNGSVQSGSASQATLFAGLLGLIDPVGIGALDELSSSGEFDDETSYSGELLSEQADGRLRERARRAVPILLQAGQFRSLYRIIRDGFTDENLTTLRAGWKLLNSETLRVLFPFLSPATIKESGFRSPDNPARFFRYEPLYATITIVMMAFLADSASGERETPIA
jgi:hypothetical protein